MQGAVHPNKDTHRALPQSRLSLLGRGVVTIACPIRIDDPVVLPANTGAPTATATRQVMNTKSERSRVIEHILLH